MTTQSIAIARLDYEQGVDNVEHCRASQQRHPALGLLLNITKVSQSKCHCLRTYATRAHYPIRIACCVLTHFVFRSPEIRGKRMYD